MPTPSDRDPRATLRSRARRVYDANEGGRIILLDGPWWLAVLVVAAAALAAFGPAPWLGVVLLALLIWIPVGLRFAAALRSPTGISATSRSSRG